MAEQSSQQKWCNGRYDEVRKWVAKRLHPDNQAFVQMDTGALLWCIAEEIRSLNENAGAEAFTEVHRVVDNAIERYQDLREFGWKPEVNGLTAFGDAPDIGAIGDDVRRALT